ncbi:SH3 domain-containing protein [Frisingicoccus sp.]|uniref:C40 family peptidase n=1 Tax=Frisingicoccus sp. TaxID=1918627 RepID=UPI003AB33A2B
MGKLKFAPCVFGIAAAVVFGTNPIGVQAAPVTTTKYDVSFGDLDIQGKIIYTATEEVASPFYKKGISTAEDCVMIRKEPSTDSEAVGKLYFGAGFEILDETDGWIHIQSGNCEGYVSADYVVTGKDAEEVAKNTETVSSYAKIVADGVEIKAEASDDAEVIATAGSEEILEVVAVIPESDWTKVNKDGVEGFVKNQAVEVGVDYTSAISMEEEAQREAELQRALEEERLAAEAAAEQTEAPAEQTEAAAEETEAPAEQTEAPAEETEAPVEETEAPAEETEAPEEQAGSESTLYIEDVSETVWTTDAVNVRANADSSSSRVGGLGKGASITRTGICDNGWSRVDYDGTTAYIHSDYLTTTEPVKEEPTYNNSSSSSGQGQEIVDYARQFLGNPYVYGGTSLTNGTDCSGFVQSVYAHFGYSLPRTCTTQSVCGRGVSVDELQPGDLVIYSVYGEIEHIAIYSGNGNTIHASNWDTGIIETSLSYSGDIYCCRRIVD